MPIKTITAIHKPGKSFVTPILLLFACIIVASCNYKGDKRSSDNVPAKKSGGDVNLLLDRPAFSLRYPDSWTIDSSSKLYDIDGHFTLHSGVESGLVTFFIYNIHKDEEETLQRHIKAQLEETMKNGTVSYFTTWGNYEGHGAVIRGKLQGIWKAEIKIFIYSSKNDSFLITSIYTDSYRDDVLPGLKEIESSFKLKHAAVVRVATDHH